MNIENDLKTLEIGWRKAILGISLEQAKMDYIKLMGETSE